MEVFNITMSTDNSRNDIRCSKLEIMTLLLNSLLFVPIFLLLFFFQSILTYKQCQRICVELCSINSPNCSWHKVTWAIHLSLTRHPYCTLLGTLHDPFTIDFWTNHAFLFKLSRYSPIINIGIAVSLVRYKGYRKVIYIYIT